MEVVIVSGGNLGDWANKYLNNDKYIIGVDSGINWLYLNKIIPNMALGDFDSIAKEAFNWIVKNNVQIKQFPEVKDETDTEIAILEAFNLLTKSIIILGGIGSRFDHSLANIHLLIKGLKKGIRIQIIDQFNEISLLAPKIKYQIIKDESFKYVSFLPLSEKITSLSLAGFLYPLDKKDLFIGESIGVSNQFSDDKGSIYFEDGLLIMIRSNDKR